MSALIFNPYFILINLFAFFLLLLLLFFLLAVSLRLFLSCPLALLLLIFRFCIPLEKPEGFWFSGVSRGRGMGVLGTFGSINDDLIWLMAQVFSGDMELERWSDMGRALETNIYQQ